MRFEIERTHGTVTLKCCFFVKHKIKDLFIDFMTSSNCINLLLVLSKLLKFLKNPPC
jgi:hypothetical protein